MTVCIAAICDNHRVLCASDRMLTAGDVQFEPSQSKIFPLTNSILLMVAGDAAMQAEILQDVRSESYKILESNPSEWLSVRFVAEVYSRSCNKARLRHSQNRILGPLGLDSEKFISRQKEMDSSFVRQVATELLNAAAPDVETIIAGVDNTGAHVYVSNNQHISCHDNIGFAAVGAGTSHANSQFMFAGHTRNRALPETLLLIYSAKKHAEVAPGVGEGTDMHSIGPQLGSSFPIAEPVLVEMEQIYRNSRKKIDKVNEQARKSAFKYVENLIAASTAQSQTPSPADGTGAAPVDQKTPPDDGAEEDKKE